MASAALLLSFACAGDDLPTAAPAAPPVLSFHDFGLESPAATPLNFPVPLTVPTYDGSGEAVHPDVLWFPARWHGWEYWMAFSPYPRGMQKYENPSIVVSHDGRSWQVPAGMVNPIINPARRRSYNSDPDLSYDARNDRLVLLNREVRGGFNLVSMLTSPDGVSWSAPRTMFRRPNHGMISPALVLSPTGGATIWYVDAGSKACRKRVTRIARQEVSAGALNFSAPDRGWSAPRVVGLVQPGYFIWHLDVSWIAAKQEYWAVYPAYAAKGCGARDLFFARSRDGITWTTYQTPVLRHEDERWTSAMLYRAALLYDASRDAVRIFLSASAPGPEWRLGYVEFTYAELLAALDGSSPRALVGHRLKPGGPIPPPPIDEGRLP